MHSLWAVIRTELWLAWRRPTFWVVQAMWLLPVGFALISNMGNGMSMAGAPFVGEQLITSLLTWLALLPLMIGPALTRDLGAPGELLWTTPLDGLTHLLGVAVGLLLALVPALLAQLAAQSLIGYALVGAPALLFWRYGPPLLLASTVVGVSVAVVLALLLRRTLVLLLLWVALWAAVTQVILRALSTSASGALASPANVFFINLQISPSIGLGPARPIMQGLVVWFTGLGVLVALLAVGAAIVADPRRAVRRGLPLATWIMVAVLLSGGGLLLHTRAIRAQALPASPADIQPDAWHVEEHMLDVAVDSARNRLTGASMLRLVPTREVAEDEVVLRLNPGLAVTAVEDVAGQSLTWERVGDSIVVALHPEDTVLPAAPLTLHLRWQGTPRPPYNDYDDAVRPLGDPDPAFATPQPVRALLSDGVGYLLRDGDWYPWPWTNGPGMEAAENRVTLHVSDADALTSAPLNNGVAVWEGELPEALLVLPPSGAKTIDDRTIHFGSLGGTDNVLAMRLEQIATLLPRFAAVGAEPLPTHIVALPYLQDLVWSGNLLLVPEGTGFLPDDLRGLLELSASKGEQDAAIEDRAIITMLARAWLGRHTLPTGWVRVRPDVEGIVALTGLPGEPGVVRLTGAADDRRGRWIRSPRSPAEFRPSSSTADGEQQDPESGSQDLRTMVKLRLLPDDHLALLALWLSVELADPAVREADLAVLLAPPDPSSSSEKFAPFLVRLLPFDFPVGQALKAPLIRALHDWLEQVGRAEALRVVGEVLRDQRTFSGGGFDLARLLAELEQRSGVAIEYEERE